VRGIEHVCGIEHGCGSVELNMCGFKCSTSLNTNCL